MYGRPSFFRVAFKQFWLLFGAIWFLVGSGFGIAGGVMLWSEWRYRTQSAFAEATVVEKSTGRGSKGGTIYYVTYEFTTPDGYTLSSTEQVDRDTWNRLAEKGIVRVQYLPAAPEKNRIPEDSDMWLPIIFSGVGVVFGGIGGFLFFRGLLRVFTILRVVREGIRVEATVAAVRESNVSVNGVRQWCVHYSYQDHAGQTHKAESDYMSPTDAEDWKVGDKGSVRYDQARPEISYWLGREEVF